MDVPSPGDLSGQRERILSAALRLMSEHGVHAMSMRRLAEECGLNVATIYHYFPSKAGLLTQVIEQRSYERRLLAEVPSVDHGGDRRARLTQMLCWIWEQMNDQTDMWRLLLGESLRGDGEAIAKAAALSATFEDSLVRWLTELVPDLDIDPVTAARVLRGSVYGFFVEVLPLDAEDRLEILRARAVDVSAAMVAGC